MMTIDSIQKSIQTADDWHRRRQPAWVSKCLSSALMGYLQLAVSQHVDAVSGVAWLNDQSFLVVMQRHYETLQVLGDQVTAGRLPGSVIAGSYHLLVFAHAAWCINAFSIGELFVAFAERKDVGELSTPFWREYARGVGTMLRREGYRASKLRLRGQEKYWMAYLRFIESASNDEPMETAIDELKKSFAMRNCDNSIKDDSYQIEGSGGHPVKWDFRQHGLLTLVAHLRQN